MSLFDFFRKKQKPTDKKEIEEPKVNLDETVKIVSVDNGSHGDNFGGLLGFQLLNSDNGQQFIIQYSAFCSMQEAVMSKDNLSIRQIAFQDNNENVRILGIRVLTLNE